MILDEFLIKFGIKADTKTLEVIGNKLENIGAVAVNMAEKTGESFHQLTNSTTDSSNALNQLNDSSKLGSEHLTKQGDAAEKASKKFDGLKTSGQKLKKEAKEINKSLGESTKKLGGFIAASIGLEKAVGMFSKLKDKTSKLPLFLGVLSSGLSVAIGGLTLFVSKTIGALDGLHQLSQETGESTEYMYRLGKVAETSGSSAEAAQASIKGLSKVIGEAASGVGRGAKVFDQYGLSARNVKGEIKQTSEMLEEIRQKMIGLSQQEKIAMLSKLGIEGSMLQVLMKSNKAFQDEMERTRRMTLGVGTKEQAQAAAEFNDALANMGKMSKATSEVVALRLAPAITRLIGAFENWFVANSDLILNGLEWLGDSIASVIDFIADFIDWIDFVITHTIGWEYAFYAIAGVMAWFAKAAIGGLIKALLRLAAAWLATPMGWLTTALIAIGLLFEDIIVWMQGGKSAFGDFYQAAKDLFIDLGKSFGETIDRLISGFKTLWENIKKWFSDFGNWADESSIKIKDAFARLKEWITSPFQSAFDLVLRLYNQYIAPIVDTISNLSIDGIKGTVSGWWDSAKQAVGFGGDTAKVGAVNNSNTQNHTVANSNNRTTVNIELKGTGNSRNDAVMMGNFVERAIQNAQTSLAQ